VHYSIVKRAVHNQESGETARDPAGSPPYFVMIDRALRDEGTSYHYAAPDTFAEADPPIVELPKRALGNAGLPATVGPSWTTNAPFRETVVAVAVAHAEGGLAVEMEAAALDTFARKRNKAILCLATSPTRERPRH
jgi:uridine phosphorylase